MRRIPLRNASVGDRLAVNVHIDSPQPEVEKRVKIDKGTELETRHINRLQEVGINSVFIADPATNDLNDFIYDENLRAAEQQALEQLQSTVKQIKNGNVYQLSSEQLAEAVEGIIDVLESNSASMAFTSLNAHTDYLASHEIDVCKMSLHLMLSFESEFMEKYDKENSVDDVENDQVIRDLGLGALLHDVGNWKIPEETLLQSSSLNQMEWEAVKRHPKLGYDILSEIDDFPGRSRLPALLHHERFSGGGYPNEKEGKDIHLFGRLVAICDVYCAMTSERPYRVELTPNRALQKMKYQQEQEQVFDPELFEKFLEIIPPYPLGQEVVLSNGTRGVVCQLDQGFETPRVRILYEGDERIKEPYELIANTNDTPKILN